MATFKSDNNLRGEVRYSSGGLLDVRLFRGETEIVVTGTVAGDFGVDFAAVLNEEVPGAAPPPLPADELAASLLSDEEAAALHRKAAKAEADAEARAVSAEPDAEMSTETRVPKKGK